MEPIELWNIAFFEPVWYKPWYSFFFIDCPQYLSDNIFSKHGIRPFFCRFYEKPDIKYIGITCSIRKKHLDEFLECMHELQRNMVICGYSDYEEFCRETLAEMDRLMGKDDD